MAIKRYIFGNTGVNIEEDMLKDFSAIIEEPAMTTRG